MRSRVIDKSAAPAAGRWDFPAVDSTAADALRGAAKANAHLLTTAQLEALERQVKEEARQRGYNEGLAAGKAEVARLEALVAAFTHPFQALERAVEDEIVGLGVELARHLVRRAVEHDPAVLHAAVADCLAVLAPTVRDVTIYFHPEDAALVRGQLSAGSQQRFKVASDPKLGRGDLRLASDSSLVDGTIAARCAEILAAARAGTA